MEYKNEADLKREIGDLGGKITYVSQDPYYELEAHFTELSNDLVDQLQLLCEDTQWIVDLNWDNENGGVLFERQ
ncbi:hypothetical protein ACFQL7_20560 [Halocatena marina]|uniref:Uncharacterized protein n=1 Tax=Halocatena marina TaxID=2934937 RepID=A0ABD5YRK1_9EURY|nr:hypothetical protein [Halocatena marina]